MISLKIAEVVAAVGGKLVQGDTRQMITNVSSDTRTIKEGDFFIPLRGDNFDGHKFIEQALLKGASGFATDAWEEEQQQMLKEKGFRGVGVVEVGDSLSALQDIAKHVRKKLSATVVGITGSTGKTCARDMLAAILKKDKKVVASKKNYNNAVGVPFTILEADEDTQVIVVEMAMRDLGEIEELADICLPDIGIVTNVGETHYELLGSAEAIGEAKGELVRAIPKKGILILSSGDSWTPRFTKETEAKVVTFGLTKGDDVRALDVKVDALGKPSFRLAARGKEVDVSIPYPGRHLVENGLAAAAAALELGLSLADVKEGLGDLELQEMRMQIVPLSNKVVILNDAYNANPTSVEAALLALKDIEKLRGIAVLGDMLELGSIACEAHKRIGKIVSRSEVDFLVTVGEKGQIIAEEAKHCGMSEDVIFSCDGAEEAARLLKDKVEPGDVVLIKASRVLGLEKIIDFLKS